MPEPDPAELLTSAMVDAGAQAIADAERDLAGRPIRQYPVSWRRTITVAALQAAASLIAAAERQRIFSQPVTQRFCLDDWVLSCTGCGAELTENTMAHAAGCSEMRLAALLGKAGSDAPPA